jgi:hypothetical protein
MALILECDMIHELYIYIDFAESDASKQLPNF